MREILATPIPLICPHCGQTAMLLRRRGAPGDDLWADDVELPDGSRPQQGEDIRCGACNSRLTFPEVNHMLWQALDE